MSDNKNKTQGKAGRVEERADRVVAERRGTYTTKNPSRSSGRIEESNSTKNPPKVR